MDFQKYHHHHHHHHHQNHHSTKTFSCGTLANTSAKWTLNQKSACLSFSLYQVLKSDHIHYHHSSYGSVHLFFHCSCLCSIQSIFVSLCLSLMRSADSNTSPNVLHIESSLQFFVQFLPLDNFLNSVETFHAAGFPIDCQPCQHAAGFPLDCQPCQWWASAAVKRL